MRRLLLQIYTKNREEAFAFYKDAFDAELGYCDRAEDGAVIHEELDICGQSIAVGERKDGAEQNIPGNTMQFCIQLDKGQEERIRKACDMLAEGGEVLMPFGKLIWTPCGAEIIPAAGLRRNLAAVCDKHGHVGIRQHRHKGHALG